MAVHAVGVVIGHVIARDTGRTAPPRGARLVWVTRGVGVGGDGGASVPGGDGATLLPPAEALTDDRPHLEPEIQINNCPA